MRKNIKYFCLTILLFSMTNLFCTNITQTFENANKLYRDGKFNAAKSAYEQISNKNFQINYNLGNCAYKLGKDGLALLYWRRAENQWGVFGRSELLENINFLKNKLSGKDKEPTKNIIIKLVKKFKNYFISIIRSAPIFFFQMTFLILWFLLFLFLRVLYQKKNRFLIIALFVFILLFGLSLVLRHSFGLSRYGVVIQKTALVSGPNKTFQQLGIIPEAKEVAVLKASGDFFKIKFNGQLGWASKKDIKKIINKD